MIAIHSRGEGRDLVLLPGWGMHRAMWGDLPELLAADARVHVCELPGYGDNVDAPLPGFDELLAKLAASSAERIDVLGWSLGGMLAQAWALRYPQQVERLVLMGSTPSFVTRGDWAAGTAPATLKTFASMLNDPAGLMQGFLGGMGAGEAEPDALSTNMRNLFGQLSMASTAALQTGLEWLRDIDLRDRLPQMKQPVLLLHGEKDVITPAEASRRMAGLLPNAQLRLIAQCGHAPHLSHSAETYAAIRNFLGN